MHYKNGRQARNGDRVVKVEPSGSYSPAVAGILYGARAEGGNDCNGRIAILSPNDQTADLKNCLHIDDIAAASIPDSTK
jgi:hypothetical protein